MNRSRAMGRVPAPLPLLSMGLIAVFMVPAPAAPAEQSTDLEAVEFHAPLSADPTGDDLRVFLVSVAPGENLLSRFGHSALWIQDAVTETDRAYNYGLSNTSAPGFLRQLARGEVMSGASPADPYQMMESYARYDRTTWVQELNLTSEQKIELRDRLEQDVGPEGRRVEHDFYLENCTTALRDVLDDVLEGQLRAAVEGISISETYRSRSLGYAAADPLLYAGLILGMGRSVDRPIDAWEEMFLPSVLRARVAEVRISDDDGAEVPLLAEETVWYQAEETWMSAAPGWRWPAAIVGGLSVAGLLLLLGLKAPSSRWIRYGFALTAGVWLVLVGVSGMAIAGLWVLTGQHLSYGNENLLLAHPLALVLGWLVLTGGLGAPRERKVLAWVTAGMAVAASLAVVLKVLPSFYQSNGPLLAFVLPSYLALTWSLWRWAPDMETIKEEASVPEDPDALPASQTLAPSGAHE